MTAHVDFVSRVRLKSILSSGSTDFPNVKILGVRRVIQSELQMLGAPVRNFVATVLS